MTELVTDGLAYWARQAPGRTAIVFDGTDRTDYAALDHWTDAAAHFHAAAGLRRGTRRHHRGQQPGVGGGGHRGAEAGRDRGAV